MSLINKMLQELDKRHAGPDGASPPGGGVIAGQLRPVKSRRISEQFWYAMAALMLAALGWVGWVVWHVLPQSVVTEVAYQSSRPDMGRPAQLIARPGETASPAQAAPASAADASAAPASAAVPAASGESTEAPAAQQVAQQAPPQAPPQAPQPSAASEGRIDLLKLATELTTPILQRRERPDAKESARKAEPKAVERKSSPDARTLASLNRDATATPPRSAANTSSGRVDRVASPRDQAGVEFRRAVALVNQGRVAEGVDALRASLRIDPTYEAVRQTLVALLLEGKRLDEAASALQEGLALNPGHSGFAMLLARVMVERKDVGGALALLQRHEAGADGNAEYHAFAAALYQRLGRHREAVDEYQRAVSIAPGAGVWWIGLGISQQALDQSRQALASFQRAKATGTLAPDLLSFADQRVQLLQ